MIIPSGDCLVNFRNWQDGELQLHEIRCNIEVMMVSFTKETCRIRGTFLETKGPYTIGEQFGNKDTDLNSEILSVVKKTLVDW